MTQNTQDKKNYKATLNLPQTAFPMKANLVQQEPAAVKRWQEAGLYQQVRQARAGAPKFSFHDGPPYANGSIHLGHLLNKALKDFVVRSRTMAGKDCPYVPGWDCHGLPIEHKVVQELGEKAKTMEPFQIRRRCQAYAEKFVKLQAGQMQRLLTLADYDHPYLTMDPAYEAGSLEVFAQLVAQGLVYRALKPVHWSLANQTALAEAELEYEDRQDTSVYVLFELEAGTLAIPPGAAATLAGAPVHLMIWTTTPWTLPANLAVAAHERYEYGLYAIDHGGRRVGVILAQDLAPKVIAKGSDSPVGALATWTGAELIKARYKHPFIDRTSPVVTAEYVTLEDGTGLVHTAPGHGVEDYQTGLREKIQFSPDRKRVLTRHSPGAADKADVYCPVLGDGRFDETAPEFLRDPSIDVWKANTLVIEKLRASGHLFHDHVFTHSYPHDWRSKTPVIFRATDQWFVGVDMALPDGSFTGGTGAIAGPNNGTLRQRAIAAADVVKFFPEWGRNRLRGMLESRPDWCISRQRAWGLPIPAFFAPNGRDVLLTAASVRAVAEVIRKHGSDHWFKAGPAELLAGYDPAADPDAPAWLRLDAKLIEGKPPGNGERFGDFKKSTDIFDVWFDSGTSWNSVIRQRFGDEWFPTDLYLEGSDQHRGWFQASLLPALGMTGRPPYKAVLTHGFMVDKDGRKMSKSLGNALEVETLLKEHGADVCRWWVSSLNTDNDIKVDPEFFRLAGEEYRKVRNTIKYLLSNLSDYPGLAGAASRPADAYTFTAADASSLDAWILAELNNLIVAVRRGYELYDFRKAHEAIFNFCNETLSAVYFAATKDRMYCDPAGGPRRRRTQTAMLHVTDALLRLIAPILPYTSDEGWRHLYGQNAPSIHLALMPETVEIEADQSWTLVIALRGQMLKAVEETRQKSGIENALDLGVRVIVPADAASAAFVKRFDAVDLADLCNISRVEVAVKPGESALRIETIDLRAEPRCDRSWKRDGTVKLRSDGGMLSDRDAKAIGVN